MATRLLRILVTLPIASALAADPLPRRPVDATHGMVVSASALASRIGADVMRQGGNAVDAAVATGLALAVTYPRAGNIGGGGFMVVRLADGRTSAIDFRETAPGRAGKDLFLDEHGNVVPGRSTTSYFASGVPGTVAGLALAHARYGSGRLTWAQLVEPARHLAAAGVLVSAFLAADLRASQKLLGANAESKRIYLREGRLYAAGDTFTLPDLAETFARLQRDGPREFYEGETARRIAADQAAHGGLITLDDLRQYHAIERPALFGNYRGYAIITMPPPSSGGVALLEMLGMLESHDVSPLAPDSATKIHLFTEAMRRAFRDRAEFLGDPDFVRVPVAGLLDRRYLAKRFADFDPQHATPSDQLAAGAPATAESTETTHYSVVDAAGNAVAVTYTLNGLYGNGVTAAGTGVLLNNEMDDFTSKVGVKNMFGLIQGEANAIAPHKRPLSSMTPTIVTRQGQLVLVTGSPGGPTIINTTLLVITNVIDHHLSLTQAVDAPRFHHQWQPDILTIEPGLAPETTLAELAAEGHRFAERKLYTNAPAKDATRIGDAESIAVDPTTHHLLGASDPRNPEAAAVGW